MANTMRKIGVYLGLVEDDPMAAPYERPGDERVYERERTPQHVGADAGRPAVVREPAGAARVAVVPPPAPTIAMEAAASIHTIHPRNYNDARRIGEEYRNGSPVIMNLSEMPDTDAKRIVDFASGLVFGQRGTIEKVTNKVFLLSPHNVDVRDAPAVQRARDGFFNQS